MTCRTTLATTSTPKLRELSKELARIRTANWWDYPNLYPADDGNPDSWEYNSAGEDTRGGTPFTFPLGHPDLFLFQKGFELAEQTLNESISELNQFISNIRKTGGTVTFKQDSLKAAENKAFAVRDRLVEIQDSLFFKAKYGGRPIWTVPILIPPLFLEYYVISPNELAELKYVAGVIGNASTEILTLADSLSYSDCDESENDENCDRIADALEAIAEKEFTCDFTEILDAINANGFKNVKVPKSIVEPPDKGDMENKSNYVTINSTSEFLVWQFKQIDALIGRFPIEITLKDTDLTQDGDQSTKVVIPNISQGISELLAISMVNATNVDATLHSSINALTEIVTARKMLWQCKTILDNIQEWTGITVKEKIGKMPSTVTPNATKLSTMLESSEIDVILDDYQGSQDGSEFDIDRLGRIVNTIYAIVSAVYVHRINKDDVAGSIRNDIGKIKDGMNLVDDEDESTFSVFLERAENAFSDAPATTTPQTPTPYGRNRDRRPLIRRTEGMQLDDIDDNGSDDTGG